jgi:hypothetical protein
MLVARIGLTLAIHNIDIELDDDLPLVVQRCRLTGPERNPGQLPQAALTCDSASMLMIGAVIENLYLTSGSWELLDDFEFLVNNAYPCLHPSECVLLSKCRITAYTVRSRFALGCAQQRTLLVVL